MRMCTSFRSTPLSSLWTLIISMHSTISILSTFSSTGMQLSCGLSLCRYNSVITIYTSLSRAIKQPLPLFDVPYHLSSASSISQYMAMVSQYTVPDEEMMTHSFLNAFINSDTSNYNYQLLEFIGDAFLKYVSWSMAIPLRYYCTLYLFYSGAKSEGEITNKKGVCSTLSVHPVENDQ